MDQDGPKSRSRGVKIKMVAVDSPAARAGLRPGDEITALDGQPVSDLAELERRLSDRAAGDEVVLSIKRRWRKFDARMTLVRRGEVGVFEPEPQPEADAPTKDGPFE